MANCFVLRADMSDYSDQLEMTIRGIGVDSTETVKETVRALLDAGKAYKMVNPHGALASNMADAESVFDAMNMGEETYMMVSDVIVWNNGKRELCTKNGWVTL